ncbi:MAG: spermidine synthase [Campylobacterales bacterium]|nr:spermidine synthase [Campylobacterales bacterium]
MKPFIYPEMMVHVGMCTHKSPEHILLISDDSRLLETELERYQSKALTVISATDALFTLRDLGDRSFDLVLSEAPLDAALCAHIHRISREDALLCTVHPDLDDTEANKTAMQILGNYYKIIMPYRAGAQTLLLCSKAYHPTADLILQRSDLLEGQQYYNCDIHIAAFAMPNYIRKAYLGIIRN